MTICETGSAGGGDSVNASVASPHIPGMQPGAAVDSRDVASHGRLILSMSRNTGVVT